MPKETLRDYLGYVGGFGKFIAVVCAVPALALALTAGFVIYTSNVRAALLPFTTYGELENQSTILNWMLWNPRRAPFRDRNDALAKAGGTFRYLLTLTSYTQPYGTYSATLAQAQKFSAFLPQHWEWVLREAQNLNAREREANNPLPLAPTALISALLAAPSTPGPGGLPVTFNGIGWVTYSYSYYAKAFDMLRSTPLGLDPVLEERFLYEEYRGTSLPKPDLIGSASIDALKPCSGIAVVFEEPVSPAYKTRLAAAAGPSGCLVALTRGEAGVTGALALPLDTKTYRQPRSNPLTGPALNRIPFSFTDERGRVSKLVERWAAIREQRAHKYGSENNWIWGHLVSRNVLVLRNGKLLVAVPGVQQAVETLARITASEARTANTK